jgi:hypothetical protein
MQFRHRKEPREIREHLESLRVNREGYETLVRGAKFMEENSKREEHTVIQRDKEEREETDGWSPYRRPRGTPLARIRV